MAKFHQIPVSEIYKETSDCSVITFAIPEHLKKDFKFVQGQHLILRKVINNQEERRTYSLCTSPFDDEWKVAVKQIPQGIFSTYVNKTLKVGDILDVMPPSGNFNIKIQPKAQKNHIAFVAGSGITPILSIIKAHLLAEPKSTFKLFYLNQTTKSIIFKEEIEQLKNKFFHRFQVFYFLTQEQRDIPFLNGRFDKVKLKILIKTFIDIEDTASCFICGPKNMIFLISEELQNAGLNKEKIHFELFFLGESKEIQEVIQANTKGTRITIIDGGKEFHFIMNNANSSILDGALDAGADLPYACKGGVCSTCKCKIIKGKVQMKVNYALEEKEINNHYILSCQAIPTTKQVIVDFDV